MSTGMPLASVKSQMFESVLGFLPDWVQITVLALIVLAVVASWVVKIKRRIAYRRAVRNGQPIHAAAQHGQSSGADHLGAYAPQRTRPAPQAAQQPSGADHLGRYAPPRRQGGGTDRQAPQPSGADFLGAYAPRPRQGDGPA
jgi:negative regulator of sigma E activity